MKLARILVPIDFSESSLAALDFASKLAAADAATLLLAHVQVSQADFAPSPDSEAGRDYALPSQHEPGKRELESLRPACPGIACHYYLLSGDPADALLNFAAVQNIDLIVVGSHGHGPMAQLLLGSVARHLAEKADTPVITVRLPAKR